MASLDKYAKAVVGATVSGLGVMELSLVDDFISGTEWVRIAVAFLVALSLVWGVQNAEEPKPVVTVRDKPGF